MLLASVIFVACEKGDGPPEEIAIDELTGFVQKGPYINGTSIQISELTEDLVQTGKSFSSQIIDNKGTFELRSLKLSSHFVELQANGFYFNEVTGDNSAAQLTLYALSDISGKNNLNINVLSHLEKPRTNYLVSEGMDFIDAKKQAQKEVLAVFEINKSDIHISEELDIAKPGEDNGVLLAVSVILQGYRTVAELSELLANMITDMREDGTLDSPQLGTELVNHASIMNVKDVRTNIEAKYSQMGVEDAVIPEFEKYIDQFIENTDFEKTGFVNFPQFSDYGENILYEGISHLKPNKSYSLAADLPVGSSLKIVLTGGMWFYRVSPSGPVNWKVSHYDYSRHEQTFTSIETGKTCDLSIEFTREQPQDSITVYYYINGSELPSRHKILYIDGAITTPSDTSSLK